MFGFEETILLYNLRFLGYDYDVLISEGWVQVWDTITRVKHFELPFLPLFHNEDLIFTLGQWVKHCCAQSKNFQWKWRQICFIHCTLYELISNNMNTYPKMIIAYKILETHWFSISFPTYIKIYQIFGIMSFKSIIYRYQDIAQEFHCN